MANFNIRQIPFHQWKQMSYIGQYQRAKENLLNQIQNDFKQEQARQLESILNEIVTSDKFNGQEVSDMLLGKLPYYVDEGVKSAIQAIGEDNFDVTTSEIEEARTEYQIEKNILKQFEKNTEEYIAQEFEVGRALAKLQALQGQIAIIKGDVFEAFLQMIVPMVKQSVLEMGEQEIEKLIEDLKVNITTGGQISTGGNDIRSFDVKINMDETKAILSKPKVDISVDSPLSNMHLGISAKNYSTLRDVHLLTGANVYGLVSQWPGIDINGQDYFMNALTVWASPKDILQIAKINFAIQSLTGTSMTEEKANAFIYNNRSDEKHPIIVVSTSALLDDVLKGPKKVFNEAFTFKFKPALQLFKTNQIRESKIFQKKVNSVSLSVIMSKSKLALEYLSRLK